MGIQVLGSGDSCFCFSHLFFSFHFFIGILLLESENEIRVAFGWVNRVDILGARRRT